MEELMVVANVAIIFGVVYKLFELFVGKKERMMLIEKLSGEELMKGGGKRPGFDLSTFTFSSLRFGCLMLGLGLGLLAGFFIGLGTCNAYPNYQNVYEITSLIYGACVLLGGGLGLLVSFLIEWKISKRDSE